MEGNEEHWKARCELLEQQLARFREQAAKVREVIGHKIKELEEKLEISEANTTQAESMVHNLKKQAKSSEDDAYNAQQRVKLLEEQLQKNQEFMSKLQSALESERQERIQHAQQVEAKASSIREWVQNKMKEFETESSQLRLESEHMKRENVNLREANHQANMLLNEMKEKLNFTQDQVIRLSEELSKGDREDRSPEYHVLETPLPTNNDVTENNSQCVDHPPVSPTSLDLPASPMSTTGDNDFGNSEEKQLIEGDDVDDDETKKENTQTAIKRSSSGKSPSKIPRYVGESSKTTQQTNSGKISYYMSLKRGKETEGDEAKFYIQVHDLVNSSPYMQLVRQESNGTINSERDSCISDVYASPFQTNRSSEVYSEESKRSLLNSVSSLCSNDPSALDVHSLYEALVRPIQSKWKSNNNNTNENPQSPPPDLPPRYLDDLEEPVADSSPSKTVVSPPKDFLRTEGQFTSYLPSEPGLSSDVDSTAPSLPSWVMTDSNPSLATDSPPYATLESSKDLLMKEQSCPVYATVKGRASQIRNFPFSGESSDSSDHESDTGKSDDYLKPIDSDAQSDYPLDTLDRVDDKKEKVLKTCATYTTVSLKKGDQRKEGFLTKLGGRIKNWKRRWFVLEDGKLYYYKGPAEVGRKPLGQVPLDGSCRISRTEGALTIEIATANRTYYLTGESLEEVDEWLRVLHNVMRKFSTSPLLAQMSEKEVMSGWVTKVKNGLSKRSWCVIREKYLCYYKNKTDAVPYSMANLMDIVVEELETADSDEEREHAVNSYRHFTLVLRGVKQTSPTYLLIDSKPEKDLWLFHLVVSSGSGLGNKGTDFEKIAAKLVSLDGNPESDLWNHPLMTFTKEALTNPLTTLPSIELEEQALKLFKSILLFTTVATDETAIDYHVSLAQNALQIVLDHPELQNEMYCMLVKQTSKHIHRGPEDLGHFLMNCEGTSSWLRGGSSSMEETIDLRPVQEFVYLQSWQLLSLCTSLFVPKQQLLSFVKAHLHRSSSMKTRQGKYAAYCIRSLERTIVNGKREARPARMEIISVLLQNPYDHVHHMKLAVHFVDGRSHAFGFDGSTTVEEFIETINSNLGIRGSSESGYAIFTDNPVSPVEHCLQASVKLCDVISKWEQAMRSNCKGRLDTSRMIKLSYKNRLYFKSLQHRESPKEKYFMVFQTNINVVKGRYPVTKDSAIEFASLMAQIQYGDYRAHSNSLPSKRIETVITKHFPKHIKDCSETEKRSLTLKMAEKWSNFHGWSVRESVDKYIENARRWPFFGSKLFKGKQRETTSSSIKGRRPSGATNTQPVWLAVEEDSISILEGDSLRLMCRYKYNHVVTFGGCKDDFMLVVNQSIMRGGSSVEQGTQRLLFNMERGKILELTLLMASYINAIVRQKGITCDVTPITRHKPNNGTLSEMRVWDLESAEWPIVPGSNVGLL